MTYEERIEAIRKAMTVCYGRDLGPEVARAADAACLASLKQPPQSFVESPPYPTSPHYYTEIWRQMHAAIPRGSK